MNKAQFISFLDAPEKMSVNDSIMVAELLKNFPYFQTAHLLYSKSLHNTNSIHYNNQLRVTAAYAADRKVLHKLITKRNEQEIKAPEQQFEKPEEIRIEEAVINLVKEEILEQQIRPIVEETIPIAVEETIMEEIIEEISMVNQNSSIEEQEPIKIETFREDDIPQIEIGKVDPIYELEKEYFSELVDASVELEIMSLPPIEPELIEQESVESNFVLNISNPVLEENAKTEAVTDNESFSFTDWLKHLDSGDKAEETAESQEKKAEKAEQQLSAFELIDKFIRDEPKLTRTKTEFFSPVNMAKQSVAEDITFVSETLAKIYVLQGNFAKAIKAYENLRLKYPEKRLYFASQIKNLRKLINQQKQ